MHPSIRKSEIPAESYAQYLENGYRRNLIVNAVDEAFFNCAINVVSIAVVLPAFLRSLGASNLLISLIPCINLAGTYLPQLFASYYIERLFRKKPYVLLLGLCQRLPFITLGLTVSSLIPRGRGGVMLIFYITFTIAWVATGLLGPAWADMMAKAIPQRLRGSFFGYVNALATGMALLGGFIVKYIMESPSFNYPKNYQALFLIAVALMAVSYTAFFFNREPVFFHSPPAGGIIAHVRNSLGLLRNAGNLRNLVIGFALTQSSLMASAFYTVYAMQKFGQTDSVTGKFVLASTSGMVIASIILGWLSDRRGHKINVALMACLNVVSGLLAVFASELWHMYMVLGLWSAGTAASIVSLNNLVFEISKPEKRPTSLGLLYTLASPLVIIFAVVAGKLADRSYHVPFYLSIVLNLVALYVIVAKVKEPRKQ